MRIDQLETFQRKAQLCIALLSQTFWALWQGGESEAAALRHSAVPW